MNGRTFVKNYVLVDKVSFEIGAYKGREKALNVRPVTTNGDSHVS
jgi:hypothetical protein